MVWLSGGALALAMGMIAALVLGVLALGGSTFWPRAVRVWRTVDGGAYMGELARAETREEDGAESTRFLVRIGNRELTGVPYRWIEADEIASVESPEWGLVVERRSWNRFYGTPSAFRVDGEVVTEDPGEAWRLFRGLEDEARARFERVRDMEEHEVGRINARLEDERLRLRGVELDRGKDSAEWRAAHGEYLQVEAEVTQAFQAVSKRIAAERAENERSELVFETGDELQVPMAVASIVRAYPANQLGLLDKVGVYFSRWVEFLLDDPRDANTDGGVFPAIVGTVSMTMIMSLIVVPFGVLAALYVREYARQGVVISVIRIAVNNLAGVPSIVFGVFGLGFFCYIVGGSIDALFYREALPDPTFGKRGLLWASLTLALLTLPVVIVATEEALAAVPSSMREGSYACGATKWQTIRRIVLPRAAPGIMTGMILAIARGAGEVAPLMLVGAIKFTPSLPVDLTAPFVHPSRSFMHLGYHIFDLGFQSPDSEAAKPMIFTTTLLLILIVVLLNSIAFWIRGRLRRKIRGVHV